MNMKERLGERESGKGREEVLVVVKCVLSRPPACGDIQLHI